MRLHATAADVLETLPVPPVQAVADHLWQSAELVPPERGVRWLREAAEQSAAVFAYEQAEELLRRALHLLARRGGAQTAALEMVVRLRLIQVLTGLHGWTHRSIEEVAGAVRALADRVGFNAETTPLWWSLWTLYTTRGVSQASRRLAHQLLEQVARAGA